MLFQKGFLSSSRSVVRTRRSRRRDTNDLYRKWLWDMNRRNRMVWKPPLYGMGRVRVGDVCHVRWLALLPRRTVYPRRCINRLGRRVRMQTTFPFRLRALCLLSRAGGGVMVQYTCGSGRGCDRTWRIVVVEREGGCLRGVAPRAKAGTSWAGEASSQVVRREVRTVTGASTSTGRGPRCADKHTWMCQPNGRSRCLQTATQTRLLQSSVVAEVHQCFWFIDTGDSVSVHTEAGHHCGVGSEHGRRRGVPHALASGEAHLH